MYSLKETVIVLPGKVSPTRTEWGGTLAQLISLDYDQLVQDAAQRGLPVFPDNPDCDDAGTPDWEAWTIEDWRLATDDPNAYFSSTQTL